ncbi:hypothetical protein C7M84_004136 [Penaeus vannamei]|uniref:Uncharacterized protein n=1 Tax=Penaeus vannamei TaxID=6689 RepID=A0A3R7MI80_PENVA|nr:hypothetical protein C7M84_004136 [Penaeus vannamei]
MAQRGGPTTTRCARTPRGKGANRLLVPARVQPPEARPTRPKTTRPAPSNDLPPTMSTTYPQLFTRPFLLIQNAVLFPITTDQNGDGVPTTRIGPYLLVSTYIMLDSLLEQYQTGRSGSGTLALLAPVSLFAYLIV